MIGKSTNETVHDENQDDSLWLSLRTLHNMGPTHIIVSSVPANKIGRKENILQMRASSKLNGKINY